MYLTNNGIASVKECYKWPSYIWYLLQDSEIQLVYGSKMWKLIPYKWREWWIEPTKQFECFSDITMDSPTPYFVDRTSDIDHWNEEIGSGSLSRLKKCVNELLLPTVLCPWGCTEYIHRCGGIALDLMFQRFLPMIYLPLLSDSDQMKTVEWARDDFFREDDDDYDCWLLNDTWKVRPSVSFINGLPKFLTCRNHGNGTKKMFLHPPRRPDHILPSASGDQLCHAVLKPRTVKQMKASKYSNSFQMYEQMGGFHGVDSCTLTNVGNFDIRSVILDEDESRTIRNRADISR